MGENQPEGVLVGAGDVRPPSRGTTTATPPSARSSDIEKVPNERLAGLLRDLVPAGQRDAGRRRQVRRGEDLQDDRRHLREASPGRSGRCPPPTPTSPPTTASAPSPCAASAARRCSWSATTCPPAPTRTRVPSTCSTACIGDSPSGRLYKDLVETKKAAKVELHHLHPARARLLPVQRAAQRRRERARGPRGAAHRAGGLGEEAGHQGRGRARAQAVHAQELRPGAQHVRSPRRCTCRSSPPWATGA